MGAKATALAALALLLLSALPGALTAPSAPVPPPTGTSSVQGEIGGLLAGFSSTYGNESYKYDDRLGTRNANDFQNQTRVWNAALGHRLVMNVLLVDAEGEELPPSDGGFDVEPSIATPAGRLWGWSTGYRSVDESAVPPTTYTRNYTVVFDIDGTPSQVSGTAFPALPAGFHVAHLDIFHVPTNPSESRIKAGSAEFTFNLLSGFLSTDLLLQQVPERIFRGYTDIGAGEGAAMPLTPVRISELMPNVTYDFGPQAALRPVVVKLIYPDKPLPKGLDNQAPPGPLGGTPAGSLAGEATQADEAATQMVERELTRGFADGRGFFNYTLSLSQDDLPAARPAVTVLVAHLEGEGTFLAALPLVLPVSPQSVETRSVGLVTRAPPAGGAPTHELEVILRDLGPTPSAGGATNTGTGDLFAIRSGLSGPEIIAKASLGRRDDQTQFFRGYIPAVSLANEDQPLYRLVAMVYASGDEFYSAATAQRGFTIAAQPVRLVEQRLGELVVAVQSLTSDFDGGATPDPGFDLTVRLNATNLPQGGSWEGNVTMAEAGAGSFRVPVQGAAAGVYSVTLTATMGEISVEVPASVTVISKEQYEKENRKWYEIPDPGLLLALLALALASLRPPGRRGPPRARPGAASGLRA